MTAIQDLIIAWTAMGMNTKGMARSLHRSDKAVEWHRQNIKRKLGFNDPARLTHYAIQNRLVELNQTV